MPRPKSPKSDRRIGPIYNFEGRLDEAIAADLLSIPWLVELKGEAIFYAYFSPDAVRRQPPVVTLAQQCEEPRMRKLGFWFYRNPSPRVLDGFMKLVDATDEDVLLFARRWGVLDLCKHGLPYSHNVGELQWGMPRPPRPCGPVKIPDPRFPSFCHYGVESLSMWREWSKRAKALMTIAADLKYSRPGRLEDWAIVAAWEGHALPSPRRDDDVTDQWHLLCDYVNGWCDLAQVSPHLVCRGEHSVVVRFGSHAGGRLFGTIGLQMLARISDVRSMAICSACGELYKPKRVPDRSRSNFCEDCGHDAAVRMAKKRQADKKVRARAMHEQGIPVSEIASSVGSRIPTVRGWLKQHGAPRR